MNNDGYIVCHRSVAHLTHGVPSERYAMAEFKCSVTKNNADLKEDTSGRVNELQRDEIF